jgi:hypothetical protein
MATDNSTFIPNRKALSSEFSYTPKPSSVNGKTFRVSVPSSNATAFTPGQTMIFNIPMGRANCVIDPGATYIRYTIRSTAVTAANTATSSFITGSITPTTTAVSTSVTNAYGAGLFLDHNAYSPFNTSTLYSGSNQLEYINGCNILYTYILDTNFSYSNAISSSLNYGMWVPESNPIDIRKGQLLSNVAGATASATNLSTFINEQNTYCVPLLSGILGIGSSGKMIPAYAINDVLRLEILLENQAQAFCQLGSFTIAPSYSIINASLQLQYIELAPEGMSLVNATAPRGSSMFIVGNSWRHYVQTIKSGTQGIFSCLVPSKLASLKNLIILPRPNSTINNASAYSLSSRVNPYFDYIQLKVSGASIPQTPIYLQNASTTGGYAEGLTCLEQTLGSLLATDKAGLLFNTNYNVAPLASTTTGVYVAKTDNQSYQNAFALAIDTELFGSKDTIINGLNCLAESMYFEANLGTQAPEDYTLDFYASFDNLFIIDQTGYVSSRA